MSIFNDILGKINELTNGLTDGIHDDLQNALAALDKFAEENRNGKTSRRETARIKNPAVALQSINEDEDEPAKIKDTATKRNTTSKIGASEKVNLTSSSENVAKPEKLSVNTEIHNDKTEKTATEKPMEAAAPRRRSNKRSKDQVEGILSPDQDKRPKRNASVRAQGVISKQYKKKPWWQILSDNDVVLMSASKLVNVNLTSKLRREESTQGKEERGRRRGKKDNDSDKENEPLVKVKEEKISLPAEEPMDCEPLPLVTEVKREPVSDELSMPPPALPPPKLRGRAAAKERQKAKEHEREKEKETGDESSGDESSGKRRQRKTTDQTDVTPQPASSRSTRANSRASSKSNVTQPDETQMPPPPEPRPKRTRAKKKNDSESSQSEPDKTVPQEDGPSSPNEKPRPKRTRRGKAAEKQEPKKAETEIVISPKKERISIPTTDNASSPILVQKQSIINQSIKDTKSKTKKQASEPEDGPVNLEETKVITSKDNNMNVTVNICNGGMDTTVVIPNGKYDHDTGKAKKAAAMNETVVLDSCSEVSVVVNKMPVNNVNDTTVVIEKANAKTLLTNVTDDNSLLTDDNSDDEAYTPPRQAPPAQPTSAVKEKVQQFEEMASRVTRTKTRAMAKKDEEPKNETPPDKTIKAVLSADTLSKMNSLIFNGKPAPQISSSASKPRANIVTSTKSFIPASTSKLSSLAKAKEAAEECLRKELEASSARKKKEAILEAKKEAQKRKREEKMAAAAAAREAAERDRLLAIEAAQKEKLEKQANANIGKLERAKEQERKKLELQRKAAIAEERRIAEERARQQRLVEEQKRAELARKKQHEEQEAMKKEEAMMSKEIEKRQKEYLEKQKLKQKMEAHKAKQFGTPSSKAMEPVYMKDGFEQLHSDSDSESPKHPIPTWSTSRVRLHQLNIQAKIGQYHIDRLFSVRVHSPDLREIFPNIERRHLQRTSSAVWRTPPNRLHTLQE